MNETLTYSDGSFTLQYLDRNLLFSICPVGFL